MRALLMVIAIMVVSVGMAWPDPEGVTFEQVTEAGGLFPSWSPDGSKLAFVRFEGESQNIWLLDLETLTETQLTHSEQMPDRPIWSPDGQWIAYTDSVDYMQKILLVKADGSERQVLETEDGWPAAPTWYPDREHLKLAYNLLSAQGGGIYLMDLATGETQQLTSGQETEPAFSRDGKLIAYAAREPNNATALWIKDLQTDQAVKVTEVNDYMGQYAGGYGQPAFSPRGGYVAYTCMPLQPNVNIYIRNLETGEVLTLTDDSQDNQHPTWSPDGQHIAFSSRRGDGNPNIWIATIQLEYPQQEE